MKNEELEDLKKKIRDILLSYKRETKNLSPYNGSHYGFCAKEALSDISELINEDE